MNKGKIIVLTGASSVGKGVIRDALMKDKDLHLFYSVSVTTRPAKVSEEDGVDYYFVDHYAFARALKNQELLEYTEFGGYYYGTPAQQVDFLVNQGKNVLVEVEAQGVGQIKLNRPDAIAFFVVPESLEELEKQIRKRYRDEDNVQQRLNKAKVELELQPLFTHVVSNKDIDEAVKEIKDTILNICK
ncbi:MAG: guanylate kinase [Erysipelotrichaceae bacterium]